MHFNKPPTTVDEQIALLIERGMHGDESLTRRWLETVGYYRLSAQRGRETCLRPLSGKFERDCPQRSFPFTVSSES